MTARAAVSCLLALSVHLRVAESLCYWSPDGVQCDDQQVGEPGISWNYNGEDGTGPSGNPPSFGCKSNGSPFGLANCACDGQLIGQAAGIKACQKVEQSCNAGISTFNSGFNPSLGEVQKVCDILTESSCKTAAFNYAQGSWSCAPILVSGNPSCSENKAREIFTKEVEEMCEPISSSEAESDTSDESDKSDESDISDKSEQSDKSDKSEDSSDECDDSGCACKAWDAAQTAGEAACYFVLQQCAVSAWGSPTNPNKPCTKQAATQCEAQSYTWVENNNPFCNYIITGGNSKCTADTGMDYYKAAIKVHCWPKNN